MRRLLFACVLGLASCSPQQTPAPDLPQELSPLRDPIPRPKVEPTDPTAQIGILFVLMPGTIKNNDPQATCQAILDTDDNKVLAADPDNVSREYVAGCAVDPTGHASTGKLQDDFTYYASGPGSGWVEALRDKLGGDCVKIMTTAKDYCGWAYLMAGKRNCYAAIWQNCVGGTQFTSVHETGHNLGLEHDAPNGSGYGSIPYAFGFCDQAHKQRDPMTAISPCTGSVRQPIFGNPNVIRNGIAWGTPSTNDPARVWRERAPIVAAYYPQAGTIAPKPTAPSLPRIEKGVSR